MSNNIIDVDKEKEVPVEERNILLEEYNKSVSQMTREELLQRDLYLYDLATGVIQGPPTGYASIDKPYLKWYRKESIGQTAPNLTVYEYLLKETEQFGDDHVLLKYYGRKFTRRKIREIVEKNKNLLSNELDLKDGDTISMIMLDTPESLFIWLAANDLGIRCNQIKFDENAKRIEKMVKGSHSKYVFATEFGPILDEVTKAVGNDEEVKRIITIDLNECLNLRDSLNLLNEEVDIAIRSENNMKPSEKVYLRDSLKKLIEIIKEQRKMSGETKRFYNNCPKMVKYSSLPVKNKKKNTHTVNKNDVQDKTALIVYTGGTTGAPKGVELTNKNIITMMIGVKNVEDGYDHTQTIMNILPPGIAFYYNAVVGFMGMGTTVDMISHFTLDNYPFILDRHKPNVAMEGPILFEKTQKSNAIEDGSYKKSSISGGDKLSKEKEREYIEYCEEHNIGTPVHQGWGLSECGAVATYTATRNYKEGTIGVPLANYTIGIFEYRTGKELRYGEIGEICICSDANMKGYLDNPEATEHVFKKHDDGKVWLHTDDLGVMDEEGRLFYKGRVKRMLTRAGNKVWLEEIEALVSEKATIDKCRCETLRDEEENEVPVLHLVLKNPVDNKDAIIEDINLTIEDRLNPNYLPKYYIFRDEFPYSEVNKKVFDLELEKETMESDSKRTVIKNSPKTKRLK